jgi:hypothetical protein
MFPAGGGRNYRKCQQQTGFLRRFVAATKPFDAFNPAMAAS